MPLPARQQIALIGGKALRIPEEGWNARTFAAHGRQLLVVLARQAQVAQRRAVPELARVIEGMFQDQLDAIIRKVMQVIGARAAKATMVELLFPSQETLWARAIQEVMDEADILVTVKVTPKVQSVMAQGYSRTNALLVQEPFAQAGAAIARRAQEIASRITLINDTTRELLRRQLSSAVDEGLTIQETANKLREIVPGFQKHRARTIARTELNRAYTTGAVASFQQSSTITHVSVIGCQAREPNSPQYRGESTCNIQDVPVHDADKLEFHINHTGTMVPSRFRDVD